MEAITLRSRMKEILGSWIKDTEDNLEYFKCQKENPKESPIYWQEHVSDAQKLLKKLKGFDTENGTKEEFYEITKIEIDMFCSECGKEKDILVDTKHNYHFCENCLNDGLTQINNKRN